MNSKPLGVECYYLDMGADKFGSVKVLNLWMKEHN